VFKLIALVRRKPGISKEEFKAYYETHHSKLGEKHLPPYCIKYMRRYMEPIASPMKPGQAPGPDYDCMVEFWFPDEAQYRAFEASVAAKAEDVKLIVEDEEKFVDRMSTYRYTVEERVSWEPDPAPAKP
jgi:hypothetical protein